MITILQPLYHTHRISIETCMFHLPGPRLATWSSPPSSAPASFRRPELGKSWVPMKIPNEHGWFRGTPPFIETSILGNLRVLHDIMYIIWNLTHFMGFETRFYHEIYGCHLIGYEILPGRVWISGDYNGRSWLVNGFLPTNNPGGVQLWDTNGNCSVPGVFVGVLAPVFFGISPAPTSGLHMAEKSAFESNLRCV